MVDSCLPRTCTLSGFFLSDSCHSHSVPSYSTKAACLDSMVFDRLKWGVIYFCKRHGLYSLPASSQVLYLGPAQPPSFWLEASRPFWAPALRNSQVSGVECSCRGAAAQHSHSAGALVPGRAWHRVRSPDISQEGDVGSWSVPEELESGRRKSFCWHSCLSFSPH